ncbi:MAG: hypothetical protein OXE43_13670 [Chloroflexi bacterium]|nr:hypothetical protein [Chloroflexota bacterium]
MEPELIDAIGNYLLAHVERHGHARTAEAFGVSRHTLWRFLERGQPGRALPRAVMSSQDDLSLRRGESQAGSLGCGVQRLHERLAVAHHLPAHHLSE